jgi:hypothetical protein
MLISRVTGDCLGCGGVRTYGNVSVRGEYVLRGCTQCRYSTRIPLPPIRKKVLYLDQFFFSKAFKQSDQRFSDAANVIADLASLQLLAVPWSTIHEDETHMWPGHGGMSKNDLMSFIKISARGHRFQAAYNVEREQLVRAFQSFLDGKPAAYLIDPDEALSDRLHQWDDYLWIDVGSYIGGIELKSSLKKRAAEELADAFPVWRSSKRNFEQEVELETRSGAQSYMRLYIEYVQRITSGDLSATFDSPIMSMVVDTLMHEVPPASAEDRLARVVTFLQSGHFAEAPYQWIGSRIFAVLRQQVRNGAHPNREVAIQKLSGFCEDVKLVSTYAPYCDAIFLDKSMGALVTDPRIDLPSR